MPRGTRRSRGLQLAEELRAPAIAGIPSIRAQIIERCRVSSRTVARWFRGAGIEPKHFEVVLEILGANNEGAARFIDNHFGKQSGVRSPQQEFDDALTSLPARPHESAGRLAAAFREIVNSDENNAAFERLLRILYALHRHSSETHLIEMIHGVINPFLRGFRKNISLNPAVRVATLATLGCAMNEGGETAAANDIFAKISNSLPDLADEDFGWVKMMSVRAMAHAFGWQKNTDKARNAIARASEDTSESNSISVVNTRAEVELTLLNPQRAWDATEAALSHLMRHLNDNYHPETGMVKLHKQPLARPHHQYGTLVLAILAAVSRAPCPLSHEQLDQAVTFATMLGPQMLGRRTRIKQLPSHVSETLAKRIARIELTTLHSSLTKSRQRILVDCVAAIDSA